MSGRHPTWFAFVRWLVKTFFFSIKGGLSGIGTENIPLDGPVIFAPVHMSHLDPPAVACACKRRLRFMAKEELFKVPVLGPLIATLGAYPVKRGEGDTESIRKTLALLGEGEAVLVFPEGTRGDGESMGPINKGVALFAKKSGAPVMPIGIVGTQIVMPRGKSKGQRHPTKVIYGRPFFYQEVSAGLSDREAKVAFAKRLENEILSLCQSEGLLLKSASTIELQPSSSLHE
jgi:1-acyl-sn-glycerol-3-phosphate acyltransferase